MNAPPLPAVDTRLDTYALVVGIDRYAGGEKWELDGAGKDALRFVRWLRRQQGVPAENIHLFLSPKDDDNGRATDEAAELGVVWQAASFALILEALQTGLPNVLGRAAPAAPCLYLYWAGHGVVTNADQTQHYIHCADSSTDAMRVFTISNLRDWLRREPMSGFAKQVCVFDVCADYLEIHDAGFSHMTLRGQGQTVLVEQTTMLATREGEKARVEAKEGKGLFSDAVFGWLADHGDIDTEALFRHVDAHFMGLRERGETTQHPMLCEFHRGVERRRAGGVPNASSGLRPEQLSRAWHFAALDFIDVVGQIDGAVASMLAVDTPAFPSPIPAHGASDASSADSPWVISLARRLHALGGNDGRHLEHFERRLREAGMAEDHLAVVWSLIESAQCAQCWSGHIDRAQDRYLANSENSPDQFERRFRSCYIACHPASDLRLRPWSGELDEALYRLAQCARHGGKPHPIERFLVCMAQVFSDADFNALVIKSMGPDRFERITNEIQADTARAVPSHLLIDYRVDETGKLPETIDYWLVTSGQPRAMTRNTFVIERNEEQFRTKLRNLLNKLQRQSDTLVVEVFLPTSQLGHAPDAWRIPMVFGSLALGEIVPVTVRWRERAMGLEGSGASEWMKVGGQLIEHSVRLGTHLVKPGESPQIIIDRITAEAASCCCSFSAIPFDSAHSSNPTEQLGKLLVSGMAFGFWPRNALVSTGFEASIAHLFNRAAAAVAAELWLIRRSKTGTAHPDFSDVTLFWDHPDRNPFSAQLSETGQRDLS